MKQNHHMKIPSATLNDKVIKNGEKNLQKIDYNCQTNELAIACGNYIEIINLLTNGTRKIKAVNQHYLDLKKVSCLKFSPNSTFLVSGEGYNFSNNGLETHFDYEVLLWNNFNIPSENLQPSLKFYSCKNEISSLNFLNNSEFIVILHPNPPNAQILIFEISTIFKIKEINIGVEILNPTIITQYNCLCILGLGHVEFWNFNFRNKNESNKTISFASIPHHDIENKSIKFAQFYQEKFYCMTSKGELLMINNEDINIKSLLRIPLNDIESVSSLYINSNLIFVGISNGKILVYQLYLLSLLYSFPILNVNVNLNLNLNNFCFPVLFQIIEEFKILNIIYSNYKIEKYEMNIDEKLTNINFKLVPSCTPFCFLKLRFFEIFQTNSSISLLTLTRTNILSSWNSQELNNPEITNSWKLKNYSIIQKSALNNNFSIKYDNITCFKFSSEYNRLLIGTNIGKMLLYNPDSLKCDNIIDIYNHEIKCIATFKYKENNLIICGANSNKLVLICDSSVKGIYNSISSINKLQILQSSNANIDPRNSEQIASVFAYCSDYSLHYWILSKSMKLSYGLKIMISFKLDFFAVNDLYFYFAHDQIIEARNPANLGSIVYSFNTIKKSVFWIECTKNIIFISSENGLILAFNIDGTIIKAFQNNTNIIYFKYIKKLSKIIALSEEGNLVQWKFDMKGIQENKNANISMNINHTSNNKQNFNLNFNFNFKEDQENYNSMIENPNNSDTKASKNIPEIISFSFSKDYWMTFGRSEMKIDKDLLKEFEESANNSFNSSLNVCDERNFHLNNLNEPQSNNESSKSERLLQNPSLLIKRENQSFSIERKYINLLDEKRKFDMKENDFQLSQKLQNQGELYSLNMPNQRLLIDQKTLIINQRESENKNKQDINIVNINNNKLGNMKKIELETKINPYIPIIQPSTSRLYMANQLRSNLNYMFKSPINFLNQKRII